MQQPRQAKLEIKFLQRPNFLLAKFMCQHTVPFKSKLTVDFQFS